MGMLFKIRDLMIRVGPAGPVGGGPGDVGWCGFCTGMDSCGSCTFCTASRGQEDLVSNPPLNLVVLKAQLQQQLEYVQSVAKGFAPDSLEEANALEKKLQEALSEVKQMKAKFSRGQKN